MSVYHKTKHRSKFHQYRHLVRLAKFRSHYSAWPDSDRRSGLTSTNKDRYKRLLKNKARFIRCNPTPPARKTFGLKRARLALSIRRRQSWPTQAGSRVRFTIIGLRKMKVVRDADNRIVDLVHPSRQRITAKQAKATLADVLAYLDGTHDDASVIASARELVAT